MYSVFAAVCAVIAGILLNRSVAIYEKDETKTAYILLLIAEISFCCIDSLWGIFDSGLIPLNQVAYLIGFNFVSYLFFIFSCLISFTWFIYAEFYIWRCINRKRVLTFLYFIPLILQVILIVSNIWTNGIFYIDEYFAYHVGYYRTYTFIFQTVYFFAAFFISLFAFVREKNVYKRKRYFVLIVFATVPVLTVIFQVFLPHFPVASIGYMFGCLIIFCFNVSREHERMLIAEKEKESLKILSENQDVITALSNSYVSLHFVDVQKETYKTISSNEFIDAFKIDTNNADEDMKNIMRGVVNEKYQLIMEAFSDVPSLRERLKYSKTLSQEFLCKNYGWCRANWIPVNFDDEGYCIEALHAVQVIDEQKTKEIEYQERLQSALQNQNEIYTEMLQMQSNGIVATDINDKVLLLNNAAGALFGYSPKNRFDGNIQKIIDKVKFDNKEEILKELEKIKREGGSYIFEFSVENEEKNINAHILGQSKRVCLSNNENILVTSLTDISKNKQMEKELVHLSETDALTGLNNRGSGEKKIKYLLSNGKTGMFGILDADKFKSVNDTFGHAVGDKVIIEIGASLSKAFRDRDIVMRLGGDEFAFFAVGVENQQIGQMCLNRFFEEINKIDIPELKERKITVSVGAVLCNGGNTFDDYYRMADSRLYLSKEISGNAFTFYSE